MKKLVLLTVILVSSLLSVRAVARDSGPTFPGGGEALDDFLSDNVIYPTAALKAGIEGIVTVKFNIGVDGSVSNVAVDEDETGSPALRAEAVRLIKAMPRWIPAKKNGKSVSTEYLIPIEFSIFDHKGYASVFKVTEIQIIDVVDGDDVLVPENEVKYNIYGSLSRNEGFEDLQRSSVVKEVIVENPQPKPMTPKEETVYEIIFCEMKPQFPGGDMAMYKWIRDNIIYPAAAREEGVSGKVIVSFIVEKDGSISDPKVVRRKHPLLDAEALRLVKNMPKWTPGKMNGNTVRLQYYLPVTFKLDQ